MTIAARYENGVFKPLDGVVIAEGTVVEIQVPSEPAGKRRPIRELGFTGMWAERDDIQDEVQYVNALREHTRG